MRKTGWKIAVLTVIFLLGRSFAAAEGLKIKMVKGYQSAM
jgi:hypothetical protein